MSWNKGLVGVAGVVGALFAADSARGTGVNTVDPVAMPMWVVPATPWSPDHVLVKLRDGAESAWAHQAAGAIEVVYDFATVPGLAYVRVPVGAVDVTIARYQANPAVEYAVRSYYRYPAGQFEPYGVSMVRAGLAWAAERGVGATVAVLDTGVDLAHEDLPAPVAAQSFVPGEAIQDVHSHGTHCVGIVLGVDNDRGVIGVAPSANLMIGNVLSDAGWGEDGWVAAGIDWAAANGANVISLSLGGPDFSPVYQTVIDAATALDVVVLAAAGNDASDAAFYPAWCDNTISVAAVDAAKARAGFSNFGPRTSLSAPGVGVRSTVPMFTAIDARVQWNGTDLQANIVTGSAVASASGQVLDCGLGASMDEFPAGVAGQIAHIRRGGVPFSTKAANALAAGAVGVIISNNQAGNFSGTLNGNSTIPVVSVSQADGDVLQANDGGDGVVSVGPGHYATFNGTSMACPHAAAVAALAISAVGPHRVAAVDIRRALEESAEDLGDPGWDVLFGHGLVNAPGAISVLAALAERCRVDFDRDGNLGVADLDAWTDSFQNAGRRADFNGDGFIDFFDFDDFIAAFELGC